MLHALKLHKNLVGMSSTKRVLLRRVHSKGAPVEVNKLKGYRLADNTMDVAVPLVMIQNYVNPCSYFLINLSIIALVAECRSRDTVIEKGNKYFFNQSIFSLLSYSRAMTIFFFLCRCRRFVSTVFILTINFFLRICPLRRLREKGRYER